MLKNSEKLKVEEDDIEIKGEIYKIKFISEDFNTDFKKLLSDNLNKYYNFKNSKFGKSPVNEGFKSIGSSRIDGLPLISIENSEETLKTKSLKERLEEVFGEDVEEISVVSNVKDHIRKSKQ